MQNSLLFPIFFVVLLGTSCAQTRDKDINTPKTLDFTEELVVDGIQNGWGMVFLPDGAILTSDKSGRLLLYKSGKTVEIEKAKAKSNLGDVKAVINDYRNKTAEISKLAIQYDSEIEYLSSLDNLNKLAREHNLRVDDIKPRMENTMTELEGELEDAKHNLERYHLDVKVYGRFLDLGHFLDDLQAAEYALRSMDINSKPNDAKVNVLIGLYSYRLITK